MNSFSTLATTGVNDVWTFVLNFLALIIIAGALFAWAWRSGRHALTSFIVALYAGYALYDVFPYADGIIKAGGSPIGELVVRIVIFGVFTGIAFWAIRRYSSDYYSGNHWVSAVLALLTAGFIIAVLYHTLGAKSAYSFTPAIDALFAPKDYFFWWFVAPLIGIAALGR